MRFLALIPLVVFGFLIGNLVLKLVSNDTNEPAKFYKESALIGKPLPKFSLPSIYEGYLGLNYNDFVGQYSLINVFASWCTACISEHDILMFISENKVVPIYGIAWKDKPEDTQNWLETHGNPYKKVASDRDGEAVISLGITGAPESFLIDRNGIVVYHHIGPLDDDIIENKIIPLIQ